jgi:hypothetical protein
VALAVAVAVAAGEAVGLCQPGSVPAPRRFHSSWKSVTEKETPSLVIYIASTLSPLVPIMGATFEWLIPLTQSAPMEVSNGTTNRVQQQHLSGYSKPN